MPLGRDVSVISSIVRIDVPDLRELRADLEAVELGLGVELGKVIKEAAAPVVTETKVNAPYDPDHLQNRKDGLPHIRDSISSRLSVTGALEVVSPHPGAAVWEFGGVIAPAGHEIQIPEAAMARQAGEDTAPELEQRVQHAIDGLLSRRNL